MNNYKNLCHIALTRGVGGTFYTFKHSNHEPQELLISEPTNLYEDIWNYVFKKTHNNYITNKWIPQVKHSKETISTVFTRRERTPRENEVYLKFMYIIGKLYTYIIDIDKYTPRFVCTYILKEMVPIMMGIQLEGKENEETMKKIHVYAQKLKSLVEGMCNSVDSIMDTGEYQHLFSDEGYNEYDNTVSDDYPDKFPEIYLTCVVHKELNGDNKNRVRKILLTKDTVTAAITNLDGFPAPMTKKEEDRYTLFALRETTPPGAENPQYEMVGFAVYNEGMEKDTDDLKMTNDKKHLDVLLPMVTTRSSNDKRELMMVDLEYLYTMQENTSQSKKGQSRYSNLGEALILNIINHLDPKKYKIVFYIDDVAYPRKSYERYGAVYVEGLEDTVQHCFLDADVMLVISLGGPNGNRMWKLDRGALMDVNVDQKKLIGKKREHE